MSVYVILHLVSESRNFQDVRGTEGLVQKKNNKRKYKEKLSEKYLRDIIPENYQEMCK